MSSSTYDARERFLASFGIGLEAAKLAINTEPAARAIFDHAVAFIADLLPKKDVVHPETARRVLDIGFKYGVDWSQGPYGSMGLPSNMTEAMERAWHQFEQGVSLEPAKPAPPKNEATRILENRIAASTGVSPSARERCAPGSHDWRYTGTDAHGSHKGEDCYRCSKCDDVEYRP